MLRALTRLLLPAAAVLVCAVPGIVGVLAAPRLAQAPALFVERALDDATLVRNDTRRGWFSSRTHVALDLPRGTLVDALRAFDMAPPDGPARLELDADVRHGLIPLAAPSRGGLVPALAAAHVDVYVVTDTGRHRLPVNIVVRGGLRSGSAEVTAQPFYRTAADGRGELRFSGLHFEAHVNAARGQVRWSGYTDELSIADPDGGIRLRGLTMRGGTDAPGGPGVTGQARLSLDALEIGARPPLGQPLVLEGLDHRVAATPEGERTAVSAALSLPSLRVGAWHGSDMALDARLDLASDSYAALVTMSNRADTPDEAAVQAWTADALARGVSLEVPALRFSTPEGSAALSLTLDIQPGATPAPDALLPKASGNLSLRVDAALLDAVTADDPAIGDHVQAMRDAGWLRREAGAYVSEVVLRGTALTANGNAVPLPF